MKRTLTCLTLALLTVALLCSLCSCFETGVEGAAKTADKSIERSVAAGGYFSEAEYVTTLEHDEDADTYVYTINVYRPEEYVNSPASLAKSFHLNYDGYFDEFENARVVINIYDGKGTLVFSDLWE